MDLEVFLKLTDRKNGRETHTYSQREHDSVLTRIRIDMVNQMIRSLRRESRNMECLAIHLATNA